MAPRYKEWLVYKRVPYLNDLPHRREATDRTTHLKKRGTLKKLCRKEIGLDDLEEDDISPTFKQKGVDMRIGLDIASIAFKKQADRIVLVSGDSDFVPAAKLARREGIEFVLDPMWASIRADLNEHIDLLRSVFPQPAAASEPV